MEKIISQSTAASYFIKRIALTKSVLQIEFYTSFKEYRNANPAKNKVAPSGQDEFLLWFDYKEETGIEKLAVYSTFYKIAFACLSETNFLTKIDFILPVQKTKKIYVATIDYPIMKRILENENLEWVIEKNYENTNS